MKNNQLTHTENQEAESAQQSNEKVDPLEQKNDNFNKRDEHAN